jgi:SAM-dependent methyltransferase
LAKPDQEKWNSRYLGNIGNLNPSDILSKYFSFSPKGRALDIACGNGRNSIFLVQKGFKVDAVDISNVALNQLRENDTRINIIHECFCIKTDFFSRICAFIAVTALGFVITLYPWERMARKVSLAILILVFFFSELLLLMLAVITFCASLFRLVFNKRFYDIAAATTGHADIFIKSYISQFFLAAGAMSGVLWLGPGNTVAQLSGIYLAAAAFSFVFLLYHLEKR